LKNHRTTIVQLTAELNICPEDIVFTKTLDMSFANPKSMVGLKLLNLCLLELMLRCINDGVTTIKPRHQTIENT
jgi:hypothetical protein